MTKPDTSIVEDASPVPVSSEQLLSVDLNSGIMTTTSGIYAPTEQSDDCREAFRVWERDEIRSHLTQREIFEEGWNARQKRESAHLVGSCKEEFEKYEANSHDLDLSPLEVWEACWKVATKQPDEKTALAKYKEAFDFIYGGIGRDFGHLEPLEAAKAWMGAVLEQSPPIIMRESGEPFLHNRADGVDGHYCIARKNPKGFQEYYEAGKWVSATSLIFYLGKPTRIEDQNETGQGGE